jgi:hypothetical protein
MDDIQRRADDEAWDKKVDPRIANINQAVEKGLGGKALAALHGLHVPPDDEPPCDVDDTSDVDDQETLRGKIFTRLIQIENTISRNGDLPDDVKRKWIAILQECFPGEVNSITLLRDLRGDLNCWQEVDPESALSLLGSAIAAVATMIQIYQQRFYN